MDNAMEEANEAVEGETIAGEPTVEQDSAEAAEQKKTDLAEQEATESKPWFQKRFNKLTAQREAERRRADELQAMLDKAISGRQQEPAQKEVAPSASPKPKMDQFESDEEYFEALSDWKVDQKISHLEKTRKAEIQANEQEQARIKELSTYEQKRIATVTAGRELHEDWDEVINSLSGDTLTKDMAKAIFETDKPAEVSYFLGKNPEEADRISKLNPYKRAIELGKIEVRLETKAPKKTTQAPPPIKQVGGKTSISAAPDPDKDPEAWIEARNSGAI